MRQHLMLREFCHKCFFLVLFFWGNAFPWLVQGNFYADLPVLMGDVDMSSTLRANMISIAVIFYSIGTLVSGPIIDAYGPRAVWSSVLLIGGMCLVGISAVESGSAITVVMCWSVYRFFQGFCWTALVVAVSSRFRDSAFTTAFGILSTSSRIGSLLGELLASFLLGSSGGWRKAVQISAAGCLMQGSALAALLTPVSIDRNEAADSAKESKNSAGVDKKDADSSNINNVNADISIDGERLKLGQQSALTQVLCGTFSSLRMLLFVTFIALVYPAFSLESLFPTYFVAQGMAATDAARVTSGWPAGMALSLPLAGFLAGRSPKLTAVLISLGVAICAALMLLLSQLDPGSYSLTVMQGLLCAMGFCYAPACYFPHVYFANAYGGDRNKGLINSILNFSGYFGTCIFNVTVPSLVSSAGWEGVIKLNATLLVLGAALIGYLQWWEVVDPAQELVAKPCCRPRVRYKILVDSTS